MNAQDDPQKMEGNEPDEAEIQQSESKSIAKSERLKRAVKQHPQRDTPRVDSVETEEDTARKQEG